MVTVRPASWPDDLPAVSAMDTSFDTDRVYRVIRADLSFLLQEEPIAPPLRKRYAVQPQDAEERGRCQCAWVAEVGGSVVGFAAAEAVAWNRRVVIHHLYVAPSSRGRGVGTRLLAAVEAYGRSTGARCLWLETQNVNYPAVRFYRRAGFRMCGLDESLYDPASPEGDEIALFLMRSLPHGD